MRRKPNRIVIIQIQDFIFKIFPSTHFLPPDCVYPVLFRLNALILHRLRSRKSRQFGWWMVSDARAESEVVPRIGSILLVRTVTRIVIRMIRISIYQHEKALKIESHSTCKEVD
jgi:hypothetical protein